MPKTRLLRWVDEIQRIPWVCIPKEQLSGFPHPIFLSLSFHSFSISVHHPAERKQSLGFDWHPECLRCSECGKRLNPGQHAEHKGVSWEFHTQNSDNIYIYIYEKLHILLISTSTSNRLSLIFAFVVSFLGALLPCSLLRCIIRSPTLRSRHQGRVTQEFRQERGQLDDNEESARAEHTTESYRE